MDVSYFLGERTAFIRYFFEQAVKPFEETIRRIREKEDPFVPPAWDDSMSTEPAFLQEYQEATAGIEIVGQTCISMLSEALKAFFRAHERDLRLDFEKMLGEEEYAKVFKKGFIKGYRTCFERFLRVNWTRCPADLRLLEQIVLARNDSQHGGHITLMRATHSPTTLRRYPAAFFVNDAERSLMSGDGKGWLGGPTVNVSRSQLEHAIAEVEKLGTWFKSDNVADSPPDQASQHV